MSGYNEMRGQKGVVLSDLHLFSGRSDGATCLESIRPTLESATILVLNGDIFDFRWSTLRDSQRTLAAALEWLGKLAGELSECRIHFIVGNHDCCRTFTAHLAQLAARQPRFQWHEYFLRLGPALFLHGDCAHRPMNHQGLNGFRELWRGDWQRGRLLTAGYRWVDRLGITRRVHEWHFPRQRTVERIAFYLDDACAGWRQSTRHCYFGHTHLPFADYEFNGVKFHNTGSAIRGMEFNPIIFETQLEPDLLSTHASGS
jgi:UDP-2,3-diacylglucosamine hydrolase